MATSLVTLPAGYKAAVLSAAVSAANRWDGDALMPEGFDLSANVRNMAYDLCRLDPTVAMLSVKEGDSLGRLAGDVATFLVYGGSI